MSRMKLRNVPKGVNAIDAFDGAIGGKLTCKRCRRDLPESMFSPLGRSMISKHGRVLTILHPHCHTCRKQERGKWSKHPDYTPELDRFWTKKYSAIASGAKNRGLLCMVDKDDLLGTYLRQDGYPRLELVPCNSKSYQINPPTSA